jgi:hypothetical protein
MAYNKDQWMASFEGQLSLLRPHLSARLLATMSLDAWQRHGRRDEDPLPAARQWSASLDTQSAPSGPRR